MKLEDNLFTMGKPKNEPNFSIDIEVVKGDITKREVDVIVNAAHDDLTGGGGVDGAIHAAAGQKLLGECLQLYGCPEGEVRITNGYDLPAKYIIHTVGPVWTPGKENQDIAIATLSHCYRNSLIFAEMQGLGSIAFPCISTGAYCFPKPLAAQIAVHTTYEWIHKYVGHVKNTKGCYINLVEFVCFSDEDVEIYRQAIKDEEEGRTFPTCHRNDGVVCVYSGANEDCRRPKDKDCIREKYEDVKIEFSECHRTDITKCDYMKAGKGCFSTEGCVKDESDAD